MFIIQKSQKNVQRKQLTMQKQMNNITKQNSKLGVILLNNYN